jgi:predicted DNA binding CopG/RHH family protein
VEPGNGARRDQARTEAVPMRNLKRPTRREIEGLDRLDTAGAAEFWQTHEDPNVGEWVEVTQPREPSEVIRLRLTRSAVRRLKARAAKAGVPFATYASAVLTKLARVEDRSPGRGTG